ncbi:hypothetical protein QBC38DRAFT_479672 [Podospora fimiseda]|uniref:Prp 4 CRoW domain-containing protein n=1 Tax=Podospora fimiseda TaxID=252190 RepID=A0AAN7BPL6_9PEZI|nr:hypothetical protein QBC38DRAFT_479672 [Podospora fimiseda]
MQIKTITTALAALAFASDVAAKLQPYKVQEVKMSTRQLFGVVRREEPGYQPESAVCGSGNTCEEACGTGYQTCASIDSKIHCFNMDAGQTCCPDKSGNSCDAGYYCASDKSAGTFCCPDDMNLEECAKEYSVSGGLVAQTAAPEPTTSSTSSVASTTSSEATTSSAAVTSSSSETASTTVTEKHTVTYAPSSTFPASNTTSISSFTSPSPTVSNTPEGKAGALAAPISALLLIAGVAALL